jgi:uncharacterized protein YaaN involved in tellurite resistance
MEQNLVIAKEFTLEEKQKVAVLAQKIDFNNRQSIIEFGTDAQSEATRLDDKILEKVKAKDADEIGLLLTDLVLKAKEIDIAKIGKDGGSLSKLPIIGTLFNQAEKTIARYSTLTSHIEMIADKLQTGRKRLTENDVMLDKLYELNISHYNNLKYYIAAGRQKLAELQDEIPRLQAEAQESGDEIDAQKVADLQQMAERLDIKIHNLSLSREICAQTAKQIRLIQGGNQLLVEKVQSSILQTIPLWKRQMVVALTLVGQRKAVELQKAVDQTTNDLLLKNSELLRTNTIEIAKANQRGIVDVDTLKKVHENFIATIDEIVKISEDGRKSRQSSTEELNKLANQRRMKLIDK